MLKMQGVKKKWRLHLFIKDKSCLHSQLMFTRVLSIFNHLLQQYVSCVIFFVLLLLYTSHALHGHPFNAYLSPLDTKNRRECQFGIHVVLYEIISGNLGGVNVLNGFLPTEPARAFLKGKSKPLDMLETTYAMAVTYLPIFALYTAYI